MAECGQFPVYNIYILWFNERPNSRKLNSSNIKRYYSIQELELQQAFKDTWKFNHSFWSNHNTEFQEEKKRFIASKHLQGIPRFNPKKVSHYEGHAACKSTSVM